MKKTSIYIAAIIIVIIIGILLAVKVTKDFKVKPTTSEKVDNKVENKENNTIKNEVNINITDEENNIVDNPEPEKPKTDLEKAIEIVKEDWGSDSSVYYAADGKTTKGEFIICVRDKNSTAALAWYTVNLEDGTFTRE